MKNKSPCLRLSDFYMQRIHGKSPHNVLDLVIPAHKFVRSKSMFENIMRWEDDGGQMLEIDHSTVDQKRKNNND
jgi:hypothetical protein